MRKYLKRLLPLTMIVILLLPLNVLGAGESTSNTFNGNLPLRYGDGIGNANPKSESYYQTAVDNIITWYNSVSATPWTDDHALIFSNGYYGWNVAFIIYPRENGTAQCSSAGLTPTDSIYIYAGTRIQLGEDNPTVAASGTISRINVPLSNIIESSPTGEGYTYITNSSVDVLGYPAYVYNPEKIVNQDGNVVFSNNVQQGAIGHSKGGVLSNYIDSTDILEDNSELPTVDTTPPQDTTNNSAWYQKILNGIGKIGLIIKGGVLTIGDYIGQAWEGLTQAIQDGVNSITNLIEQIIAFWGRAIEKIEDITDDLHTIAEKITEENTPTEIANAWETGYHSTVFYGMEQNITTGRQEFARLGQGGDSSDLNLGRWKITHKNNSISIIGQLDLPTIFGGVTTDHEMTFRWYQQIKSWFIPVLNAFLVLEFTLHLVRQFPGFINGQGTDLKEKMKK